MTRTQNGTSGIGLVETYDVSPTSTSKLANLSTRGFVGSDDDVLIGGFIVGDVASSTLIVRAIGPSLTDLGVSDALVDPSLTIYDVNGTSIAANDDWRDDAHNVEVQNNGLAPKDASESALALFLPPGNYSAIVRGADGGRALVWWNSTISTSEAYPPVNEIGSSHCLNPLNQRVGRDVC